MESSNATEAIRDMLISRRTKLINRLLSTVMGSRRRARASYADPAHVQVLRDQTNSIRAQTMREVEVINMALERVDLGDYGKCTICGRDIEPRRLEALPQAITCIICERSRSES